MKIHNLIFLCFLALIACEKEEPTADNTEQFPQEYLLTGFDYGQTVIFDVTADSPEKIDISGSFIASDQITEKMLEADQSLIVPFETVRFLDEKMVRLKFPFQSGVIDTSLNYVRSGEDIFLVIDGSPLRFFHTNAERNELKHCLFSFWGSRTVDGGWSETNPGFMLCRTETDEEMAELVPLFLGGADTVAINRSDFVFELQ